MIPSSEQLGATLKHSAYRVTPFICITVTAIWLMVDAFFDLGKQLGNAVHQRNAELAALHLQILGLAPEPQLAVAMALPVPAPSGPDPELAAFRCRLNGVDPSATVAQLRALARQRGYRGRHISRGRRAELLDLLSR